MQIITKLPLIFGTSNFRCRFVFPVFGIRAVIIAEAERITFHVMVALDETVIWICTKRATLTSAVRSDNDKNWIAVTLARFSLGEKGVRVIFCRRSE